jgi:hypothetical protein
MHDASTLTGDVAALGKPTSFREKAWASLASTAGMFLACCAYLALDSYGPSSRIVFYDYLPFRGAFDFLLVAVLGAWLGAWYFRVWRPGMHYSSIRLAAGCLLGGALGLIVAGPLVLGTFRVVGIPAIVLLVGAAIIPAIAAWWCGIAMFRSTQAARRGRLGWLPLIITAAVAVWLMRPQIAAFPEHGSVAEREAWARVNIRQYMSLTRTVEKIPLIQESVGRVTAIAPASGQQQVTAVTMDGIEMDMVLDVVGNRGTGALHVNCTIDGDVVFDWQPATWTMDGHSTEISSVPNLFRR